MDDSELLKLYQVKRTVDGLNGRPWDAHLHWLAEDQIMAEERYRQLKKDIESLGEMNGAIPGVPQHRNYPEHTKGGLEEI